MASDLDWLLVVSGVSRVRVKAQPRARHVTDTGVSSSSYSLLLHCECHIIVLEARPVYLS